MKNLLMSYFMCAAGLFTPLAGLHRFYLEKPLSGIFYLLTWGFFGIGTIIDLIRMPSMVDEYNMRLFFSQQMRTPMPAPEITISSPDRAILRCAKANDGVVTVQMVALSSGLSLAVAKVELNRLYQDGFCHKDVDEDGNEIYQFQGLKAKKPVL